MSKNLFFFLVFIFCFVGCTENHTGNGFVKHKEFIPGIDAGTNISVNFDAKGDFSGVEETPGNKPSKYLISFSIIIEANECSSIREFSFDNKEIFDRFKDGEQVIVNYKIHFNGKADLISISKVQQAKAEKQ